MPGTPRQTPLLVADVQQEDGKLLTFMRRLGIEALPTHETMPLPIERIMVPGAELLARPSKRLVKSIQHVGILQAPSVVLRSGTSMHDPAATFEVITGRRRVLAAACAGLTVIKCEVYATSTPQLSALLALIENEQRSAAWVKEVEDLHRLIDGEVGMTIDDLAAIGFDRATLSERLKIAQLPSPLLNRILAGEVSREVARKLARLTQVQQERIAGLASTGEEITAKRVKDILRAQINAGLVPVQTVLVQGWNAPSSHKAALADPAAPTNLSPHGCLTASGCEAQAEQVASTGKEAEQESVLEDCSIASTSLQFSPLSTVLDALHAFEHSPDYQTVPRTIQTLTQALVQQLRIALRDMPPASQTQPTVQPHSR